MTFYRLGLTAVAVVAFGGSVPAPATPVIYPARVQVVAHEFRLSLSRVRLRAGPVIVQLANFGEDPHDLRFRRAGGARIYAIPTTPPGADRDLEVKLRPGKFTLWCSIGDHRQRGMKATLSVVPR